MRARIGATLALVVLAGVARADDRDARVAGADALFKEGDQLFSAGRVHEACERFAASQNLDPALGTLINLAICHARDGKTGSAWSEFESALAQATKRRQTARIDTIKREMHDLEARLSRVIIDFGGATPSDVKIDGRALDASAWSAPMTLDPGVHQIEITIAGGVPTGGGEVGIELTGPEIVRRTIHVGEGPSSQTIAIVNRATPPAPVTVPPPPTPTPATEPPPDHRNTKRTVGFIVGGVGIVGVAIGAAFGLSAVSRKNDADASCQGRVNCPLVGYDANNDAHTDATISTIAFGVGLAALGVGTYLVLTSRSSPAQKARAPLRVVPVVEARGGTLLLDAVW